MNEFLITVILVIFGSINPSILTTNTLLYPIKKYQRFIMFCYVFIVYYFLGDKIGQLITPIVIIGMILFVTLFSKKKALLNISCFLFGYSLLVAFNHIVLIILGFFDISIATIAEKYAMIFNTLFTLSAFILTYVVGKIIRKKLKDDEIILKPLFSITILTETVIIATFYICNMIFGERLGYSINMIKLNGTLFILVLLVLYFITYIGFKSKHEEEIANNKVKNFEKDLSSLHIRLRRFSDKFL